MYTCFLFDLHIRLDIWVVYQDELFNIIYMQWTNLTHLATVFIFRFHGKRERKKDELLKKFRRYLQFRNFLAATHCFVTIQPVDQFVLFIKRRSYVDLHLQGGFFCKIVAVVLFQVIKKYFVKDAGNLNFNSCLQLHRYQ